MRLLIKNGRVVDPAGGIDGLRDILIEGAAISRLGENLKARADKTIDAAGKIVMPGLVDMHVHLREPGREDKETVASGTRAALKGGVTSMLAMPNTNPCIDTAAGAKLLKDIIRKTASAHVFIAGAITLGRQGSKLVDIPALKKAGIVAITDDGASVDDPGLLLKALKAAREHKVVLVCHCEDRSLSAGGAVNLGFTSTKMGLRGASKESEYARVKRDIGLAGKIDAPLHIAHVSCRESLEIIAAARKKGIKVTCETAPHYFALNEEAVWGYDTNCKVNPPLRTKEDMEAIRQGLACGTIDAIASDHAPHTENEKDIEFERAEFGLIGLETELAVSITELVKTGLLGWADLVRKLSLNPARILDIDRGSLSPGEVADIAIVDPDKEWMVTKESFISKSRNSCFINRRVYGSVEYTLCAGRIAYQA